MNQESANVRNKVILVTGASQGIGGATARLCASRGARVIITDVKADKGEETAAAIRAEGGEASFMALDVRDAEAVQQVFAAVQEKYGRLDVLVCAAGVLQGQYLQPEELSLETFEFVMDVNVKGSFLCAKYATPLLAASKGTLILIASGAGVIGGSSSIAYGTSKGAVNGMGMTLESHLAPRGIRVNVVCPGNIHTELKLGVIESQAQKEGKDFDKLVENSRLGDPIGVARIIAFLASDDAEYFRQRLFTR